MSKVDNQGRVPNSVIATIAFYALYILLFPLTAAGYVLWVIKAYGARRTSSVSATAQAPLLARWFQHNFGTRLDEASNRLMLVLPDVSHLALRLISTPLLFPHRLTNYVPKSFRYPFEGEITIQNEGSARTTFFDSVVDQYIPQITQFVILGAGFDTRTFRLPTGTPVQSFEIDMPKTQAIKRQIVQEAHIDLSRVTFVPADFEKDDWLNQLVQAGFDLNKPALFIWEGVLMYLDKQAVEDTLRKIARTAKGSILAFDYMTTEFLNSSALGIRSARAALAAGGEPLKFGVDSTPPSRDRLAELLQPCGLSLVEQQTFGKETDGKRAWGGFAIAIVN
jgi:methyltransferase (TIGR00027 family)